MTLAQKRAVTFDQFWPLFQRHHRVELAPRPGLHLVADTLDAMGAATP
jgi:hypothetical protein